MFITKVDFLKNKPGAKLIHEETLPGKTVNHRLIKRIYTANCGKFVRTICLLASIIFFAIPLIFKKIREGCLGKKQVIIYLNQKVKTPSAGTSSSKLISPKANPAPIVQPNKVTFNGTQKNEFGVCLAPYQLTKVQLDQYLDFAKGNKNINKVVRIPKEITGFAHTISATPDNKVIVHIKRKQINKGGFLGNGGYKKVYKALIYDGKNIEEAADLTIVNRIENLLDENHIAETLIKNGSKNTAEHGNYVCQYLSESPKHVGAERFSMIMPIYDQNLKTVTPSTSSHTSKIKIMKDVASGIAEMHDNKIYHRDLKLENILTKETEKDGQRQVIAKVADFGFSTSKLADETIARGNKAHWPPEVFRAGKERGGNLQGAAADVWAIGIMLYQLFYIDNRKHTDMPFVRSMLQNIEITDLEINLSLSRLADVDNQGNNLRPIKALMLRCLQHNPDQRIKARQVAEELDRILLN